MTRDDFRRRAAAVRDLPLVDVLLAHGAVRDRQDRCKWHSDQGPLSITGAKFFNWSRHRGGGGAIDLVMHLTNMNYPTAVVWLEQHFAPSPLTVSESLSAPCPSRTFPGARTPPLTVYRPRTTSNGDACCAI
ncbi:MAG: hypothetical protein M5U09_26635 [Gammaproteobacteria bacterium]|nr:hypothetical protein [Gammaproteobacteria bacterium]